jgi:hypothetical protein
MAMQQKLETNRDPDQISHKIAKRFEERTELGGGCILLSEDIFGHE